MSIAVGNYLYTWPMSENPAPGSGTVPLTTQYIPNLQLYIISANPGQTPDEIAISPAITTSGQ